MKRVNIVATSIVYVLLAALMLPSAMGQDKAKGKIDLRVKKALDTVKYKYVVTELKNYRLEFDLPDGERSHLVFVSSQTTSYESMEVRKVWGVAYKTDKRNLPLEVANRLLRLNVQSRLGAWEFSARDKGANRLKYVVRVNADCPPEDLKSAITAVLHTADRMEKSLTKGKDDL